MNWTKLFQAIMQTEEAVLPIFIHNPASQKVVGAIVVAESIFGQMFGGTPTNPVPTATGLAPTP